MGPSYRVFCEGTKTYFSSLYEAMGFENIMLHCGRLPFIQINRHDDKGWVDYV